MDELFLLRCQWPTTVLQQYGAFSAGFGYNVSPCGYISLILGPVVAVSGVLVHSVEGHATGQHGLPPRGA